MAPSLSAFVKINVRTRTRPSGKHQNLSARNLSEVADTALGSKCNRKQRDVPCGLTAGDETKRVLATGQDVAH